ncbi:MAG TPA: cysteine dioxygenase family protein [Trebonia sp.]
MTSSVAELPAVTGTCPESLTAAVRRAVRSGGSWQQTADRVVAALRGQLPGPGLLSPGLLSPGLLSAAQLAGDPSGYQTHLVHDEPDGSFSVVVMVWLPGQATPVHDHLSWCCTAVLRGTEYEEVYAVRGDHLEVIARNANPAGTVSGFAPPGDVHLVRNIGDTVAVSLHVYGTDIARVRSSVRRVYDLPVR